MEANIFTPIELDAIGEIMNISLGSSATAVSSLLERRVEITTPRVAVVPAKDFEFGSLLPAVAVEVPYISGLHGNNILLFKRADVKLIIDLLLNSETPDDEFEMTDLTISAICEVMNQMMGASATALADFLGRFVNISPPQATELTSLEDFGREHFPDPDEVLVVVSFSLNIDELLKTEFFNIMYVPLARELLAGLDIGEEDAALTNNQVVLRDENDKLSHEELAAMVERSREPSERPPVPESEHEAVLTQEEIDRLLGAAVKPQAADEAPEAEQKAAPPESAPAPAAVIAEPPPIEAAPAFPPMFGYPPPYYPYPAGASVTASPKTIQAQPLTMPQLSMGDALSREQAQNLELIMSVPLEVSVEIGRTRRKVKDILALSKGSLVVLDKLAGDQVDLFVNGKCIAKGDVVVVDDNFGIRITQIIARPDLTEVTAFPSKASAFKEP